MKRIVLLFLSCFVIPCIFAQVVETYYPSGILKSRIPINLDGLYEGTGYIYDSDGALKEEIPYQQGVVNGLLKEYYPEGVLKSKCEYVNGLKHGSCSGYYATGQLQISQEWREGKKNGPMFAWYPDGMMRMYGLLENDSLLFAQRFDTEGMLLGERVRYIPAPIDTSMLPAPEIFCENGQTLSRNHPNAVQVFIPQVPSEFISFASTDGKIDHSGNEKFPLLLTPNPQTEEFVLYLRIKTHSSARPILIRSVRIPVH
ncbi:MAG: hypothetical protein SF052_27415 [Bacteroidia bacterium]|nr:hypothetical protein [Bacteroidia bacterium]